MYEECTQTCACAGKLIFAHCDGSSALGLARTICSMTVTVSPWFKRLTISLLSRAWPRTLTLLPVMVAGPGESMIGRSAMADFVSAGAFFLAGLVAAFFFAAFVTGAFEPDAAVAFVEPAGGEPIGGGFVTGCASKLRSEENTS